jgi:hypothetical protein
LRIVSLATLGVALVIGSVSPGWAAMTCTQKNKVCIDYCAHRYTKSSSGCTHHCADAMPICMSTGCWKTPLQNQCGITKS